MDDPSPYAPPSNADVPPRRRFRWGIIPAIPLFIYGIAVFSLGSFGVLVLLGFGQINGPVTVFAWGLFHAGIMAHGCLVVIAALRLCKSQWWRATKSMLIAFVLLLLFMMITAA